MYNEDSCRIFNTAGVEKLYATFDFAVSKIRKGRMPDTLIVTGPQQNAGNQAEITAGNRTKNDNI